MQSRPILRLQNLHQRIDRELVRELKSRLPNGVEVVRLKKTKLMLKDHIAAISASKPNLQST